MPWDGKEQIFRDVEVSLKCILEVRRSPENYIRRLSADQARQLAAQQSFVPMWDADAAAMAMANIRRLIQSVPVYRVFCGPDAADARAVHDILIHHPEQIREEEKDMRIKDGFVLRNVIDEYVVMPTGDNIAKFAGTVVLNEVSAFLFKQLENPVSRADLLSALLSDMMWTRPPPGPIWTRCWISSARWDCWRTERAMKPLLREVWDNDRRAFLTLLGWNIGVSLLGGIGIVMLIPLLNMLQIGDSRLPGWFLALDYPLRVGLLLAAYLALVTVKALLSRALSIRESRFIEDTGLLLEEPAYAALSAASWRAGPRAGTRIPSICSSTSADR